MVAPWQCERTTDDSSPTVQAISVVSGPIEHPDPTLVPAWSWVPGRISVSGPIVTSACSQVVAGSCTVTPASWARRTSRALSSFASSASWTRSLTPSVSSGSGTSTAPTGRPSLVAMPTTSVRYCSPAALALDRRPSASISTPASKAYTPESVSYTHLRAHETDSYLVCRL